MRLRNTSRPAGRLEGGSGGPCARMLVEGAEYVFALGHANDAGVGRVNAGTSDKLQTSIALQRQIAKTKVGDTKARAGIVYRAATAKTVQKEDLLSLLAYLAVKPDIVAAQPELAAAWTKLITK